MSNLKASSIVLWWLAGSALAQSPCFNQLDEEQGEGACASLLAGVSCDGPEFADGGPLYGYCDLSCGLCVTPAPTPCGVPVNVTLESVGTDRDNSISLFSVESAQSIHKLHNQVPSTNRACLTPDVCYTLHVGAGHFDEQL